MINKYLKSLLANNKRVIIPDFGGLVVKRSAAGDIISFNSFLKFNDDLLLKTVMKGEKLEKNQAMKLINDFVADLVAVLDKEEKYELEDVGFLVKDKKGNIRFVDTDDMTTVIAPSEQEEKEGEAPKETVSDTTPKETIEDLPSETNEKESENSEDPEDEETEKNEVSEEEQGEILEETKSETIEEPQVMEEDTQENKKKNVAIWWVIPVVLLVAVGAWFLTHKDSDEQAQVTQTEMLDSTTDEPNQEKSKLGKKQERLVNQKAEAQMKVTVTGDKKSFWQRIIDFIKGLFAKKGQEETQQIQGVENVIKNDGFPGVMAPLQVDTVSGIMVVADKYISAKGKERYNVIIGSFSESENAMMFNQTLINNGLASEVFDRYNGFSAVSYGSYPSLDIALRVCGDNIELTPDIWILVK